jgi:hypothetical protein
VSWRPKIDEKAAFVVILSRNSSLVAMPFHDEFFTRISRDMTPFIASFDILCFGHSGIELRNSV